MEYSESKIFGFILYLTITVAHPNNRYQELNTPAAPIPIKTEPT